MRSDREQDGLVGQVQTVCVKLVKCSVREEKYAEDQLQLQAVSYDAKGNKTLDILYNENNFLIKRSVYAYDANEKLIEVADYSHDGHLIGKVMYNYDSNGGLVEWTRYKGNGLPGMKGVSVYDADGKRIEQISGENFLGKEIQIYDEKGSKTDLGVYTLELAHAITSVYDVSGNPSEVTFYGDNGVPLRKLLLTYNDKRRLTEITDWHDRAFLPSGLAKQTSPTANLYPLFKRTYEYNAKGQKTEERECLGDGSMLTKTIYTYDLEGKLIEKTQYNASGSLSHKEFYTHEYGSFRNWIKEATLEWNLKADRFEPIYVTYRTITYYRDNHLTELITTTD